MKIKGSKNIIPHKFIVDNKKRMKRLKQHPKLIWFTGLSGSGKSTIANSVEKLLFDDGYLTYALDGDNVRDGINSDLSFTDTDRRENIRRIGEVAKLMLDAGLIVCASFVSPFISEREKVKSIVGAENFIEIYVSTSLEECERRDVKGLYAKARSGEIKNFTGISSVYEIPISPNIEIDTKDVDLQKSCELIIQMIKSKIK